MKSPPKKGAREGPPTKAKKAPPAKSAKAPPKKAPTSGKALSPEQEMLARGFRPTGKRERAPMAEELHTGSGEATEDRA